MITDSLQSDDAILKEIGRRLARRRMDQGHTQADLAEQAGVSKRTVERIESGHSSQMSSMIRILRVLGWLAGIDQLFPETGPSPMDLLRMKGKQRQRASGRRTQNTEDRFKWVKFE
jgi:transcriptional regulator with XRE-family HTH domain